MDGWQPKKRKLLATQPPLAPLRKPRFTKKMARQRELELEDEDWLLHGGPAPAEAPPGKLTCTPVTETVAGADAGAGTGAGASANAGACNEPNETNDDI